MGNIDNSTLAYARQRGLETCGTMESDHVRWKEGPGLPTFTVEGVSNPLLTDTLDAKARVRISDDLDYGMFSLWEFPTTENAIKAVSNPLFRQVAFLDLYSHVVEQNPQRAALIRHLSRNLYFGQLSEHQFKESHPIHGMHLISTGHTPNLEKVIESFVHNLPTFTTEELNRNCNRFSELLHDAGFTINWETLEDGTPGIFSLDIDSESEGNLLNTPELIPDEVMAIGFGNDSPSFEEMRVYCEELAEIGYLADYDLSGEFTFLVKASDISTDIDLDTHSYLLSPGEYELFTQKNNSLSPS
jgi:hypothetical protein